MPGRVDAERNSTAIAVICVYMRISTYLIRQQEISGFFLKHKEESHF
jgi:hypothetical protein